MKRLALLVVGLSVALVTTPMTASAQARPDAAPAASQPAGPATSGSAISGASAAPTAPVTSGKARPAIPPARKARPSTRRASRPALRDRRLSALTRQRDEITPEDQLRQSLDTIWSGPHLRRGTTAVYVVDTRTGRALYAANEDESLNPASNVKLISTAAALDVLGPDHRYHTRVLGPEPDSDGVVAGHLYMLGEYNPSLHVAHVRALAQTLAERGITEVQGDIHVGLHPWRESVARPRLTIRVQGTSPDQPPAVTIEPASGFVAPNITAVTDKRARRRTRIAVDLQRLEDDVAGDSYQLDVSGTISPGRQRTFGRWLSRGPQLTGHILRQGLIDAGIPVSGTVRRSSLAEYIASACNGLPIELARHESPPLSEIVAAVNKYSINRLADRVVMTAAAQHYGGEPSMKNAVRLMEEWLRDRANVNPNHVYLDTGSGLSYNTQLTARQIVKVLRAASGLQREAGQTAPAPPGNPLEQVTAGATAPEGAVASNARRAAPGVAPGAAPESTPDVVPGAAPASVPGLGGGAPLAVDDSAEADTPDEILARRAIQAAFRDSLSVGGMDGTLRRRFRRGPIRGKVVGKTGTLTQVIALSGIVAIGDGPTVAFAIVSNGHDRRKRNRVRREHESIVNALYAYLQARATVTP